MGSASRFASAARFAAAALLFVLFGTASNAAAAKHKKKKPPPAAAQPPPTNGGELDAPPPAAAPTPPPPPAAPPAAASPPAAAPEATESAPAEEAKPAPAHARAPAALTLFGSAHTLMIDDISGFRASNVGGVGYSGPIGFSAQSFSENVYSAAGATAGTQTFHFTTFWVAPSADYFVIEHLSIGAVLQVATTSGNYDQTIFGTPAKNQSLPTTTDITVLVRGGWMVPLGDTWGLWPRIGLGYASHSAPSPSGGAAGAGTSQSGGVSSFVLDLDVGVLYRLNQTWFLRAAPELTFAPASSFAQFAAVAGFGAMWNL